MEAVKDKPAEDKTVKENEVNKQLEDKVAAELFNPEFFVPYQVEIPKSDYYSAEEAENLFREYEGYLNISRLGNSLAAMDFDGADYPKGLYGTFNTLTRRIQIADHTRADLEQREITKVHEYALHFVMGLPDGYVARALEQAMCWREEKKERYRQGVW